MMEGEEEQSDDIERKEDVDFYINKRVYIKSGEEGEDEGGKKGTSVNDEGHLPHLKSSRTA